MSDPDRRLRRREHRQGLGQRRLGGEPTCGVAGAGMGRHGVAGGQHADRVQMRHELRHMGVARAQDDVLGPAGLDDAPALQDGDRRAELHRLLQVVADEEDRAADPGLERLELVLQPGADQRVERRERFVHQQDRGLGGERAGEADALAHAAREGGHRAAGPVGEADEVERRLGPGAAGAARQARQLQPQRDVARDAAPGQQCELLEDHRHAAPAQVAQGAHAAAPDLD